MLRCERITKSYNEHQIFHDLSYHFDTGIYAIQGPNGIGKTTLLEIFSGAIAADFGDVWIKSINLNKSPLAARLCLSFVPDESPIYPFMSGIELLEFVAMAKKTRLGAEIMQLVEQFGLSQYLNTRFSAMSLGTQKKFMLCAAWIGEPQVLLLDEPSNGLDIAARELLAGLLQERRQSRLILFSTHDADFIAACAAKVLSMEQICAYTQ